MGASKSNGKTTKKPVRKSPAEVSDARPRVTRKKTPAATAAEGNAVSADLIAARAYQLYLERGAEDGHDFEDWLAAERELRSDGQ